MWHMHGLSSVIGCEVHSVYPENAGFTVRKHLHRLIKPRVQKMGKYIVQRFLNNRASTIFFQVVKAPLKVLSQIQFLEQCLQYKLKILIMFVLNLNVDNNKIIKPVNANAGSRICTKLPRQAHNAFCIGCRKYGFKAA
jgi:hypothetical protein